MIRNIIKVYHDKQGHCGTEKTVQGILTNYWFPSLRKKVRDYVDNCLDCFIVNSSVNIREGELQLVDNVTAPLQTVHCDRFGPITESSDGFKHILIVKDNFTRFIWLFSVKSTSSKEATKHFRTIFSVFGNPRTLVLDRGIAFTFSEFFEFLQSRNIYHRKIAVAAP